MSVLLSLSLLKYTHDYLPVIHVLYSGQSCGSCSLTRYCINPADTHCYTCPTLFFVLFQMTVLLPSVFCFFLTKENFPHSWTLVFFRLLVFLMTGHHSFFLNIEMLLSACLIDLLVSLSLSPHHNSLGVTLILMLVPFKHSIRSF